MFGDGSARRVACVVVCPQMFGLVGVGVVMAVRHAEVRRRKVKSRDPSEFGSDNHLEIAASES